MNPNSVAGSNRVSRSNGARGRIAQVIADARASLDEPTRPFTPQLLDDKINSTIRGLSTMPPASNSRGPKISKKSTPSTSYDFPNPNANTQAPVIKNENTNNYETKLLLNDICDLLLTIEINFTSKKIVDEGEFNNCIAQLKEFLEKMTKKFKTNKSEFVPNDLFDLQAHMYEIIAQISEVSSLRPSLKIAFFGIILRYCLYSFHPDEINHYHNNITFKNIEILTQSLFNLHTNNKESNINNGLGSNNGSNKSNNNNNNNGSSSGKMEGRPRSHDTTTGPATEESEALATVLDIYVDYIPFLLKTIDFFTKYDIKQANATSNNNQTGSSSNSRVIYQLFQQSLVLSYAFNGLSYITASLKHFSNHEIHRKKLMYSNLFPSLRLILEFFSSSYYVNAMILFPITAGRANSIPSSSSSSSSSSVVLPAKDVMMATIDKILLSLSQTIILLRNFSLEKVSRECLYKHEILLCLFPILTKYAHYSEIILNIARVLAKLSLYESFRAQINSKNVPFLDALVKIIHKEADKCRRIMDTAATTSAPTQEEGKSPRASFTGKSLRSSRDGGNQQLQQQQQEGHGHGHGEEDSQEISFEDESDETKEESWPAWYTWPMISRISFTLGNLTTSNEGNRRIIGTDLNATASILLLLQVCGNSLARINQQNQDRDKDTDQHDREGSSSHPYENLDDDDESDDFRRRRRGRHEDDEDDDEDGESNEGDEEEEEDDEDGYEIDHVAEVELRDATIKLIRLLANISIDPSIGMEVGSKNDNLQTLMELLVVCDHSVEHEEMLLNVVAALTNLTFYSCQFLSSSNASLTQSTSTSITTSAPEMKNVLKLEKTLTLLSTSLSNCLFHENQEIILETLRVLGNLTRLPRIIDMLIEKRIEEAFFILLQYNLNSQVLSAIIGIFINLTASISGRKSLLFSNRLLGNEGDDDEVSYPHLIQQFSAILRKLTLTDISIATLICQALFNIFSSAEFKSLSRPMVAKQLVRTLEELLEISQDEQQEHGQGQGHQDFEIEGEDEQESRQQQRVGLEGQEAQESQQFVKIASSILQLLEKTPTIQYI